MGSTVQRMSDRDLMTLSTTQVGATAVVTVTGELDLHTSRELMVSVDDTFARPGLDAVVIDLTGVSFLGSSGLGTLAELATRAPASRRPDEARVPVRLVSSPDNRAVVRPWETMNLQQILPLYPDVDAALAGPGR
jgi:anti-sigma B factor antagonist